MNVVGECCSPAVGDGDLLIISAGPSQSPTVNAVALEAKRAGLSLTSSPVQPLAVQPAITINDFLAVLASPLVGPLL